MPEIHDQQAERAVLGAILADNATLPQVGAKLKAQDFHTPAHSVIWDAMIALRAEGQPVDHLTVADRLKKAGKLGAVGGPAYLMQLDQQVPSVANALSYAEIVRDRAARRRLAAVGRKLAEMAEKLDNTPAELQGRAARALAAIGTGGYEFRNLTQIMAGIYQQIDRVQSGERPPVIPYGIASLDNVVGGAQPTLIVFGARTGVGKSAWASTVIQNMARAGYRVGVFSLEDEGEWLGWRYLAAASGVNQFVLRYRHKSDAELERIGDGSNTFAAYSGNVLVDDRQGLSSAEIGAAADDMVINYGAQVIVVDHLSEVNHHAHRGADRFDLKIEQSLIDLRAISKRHGIPVILLCQVVEKADQPDEYVPTLADFANAREISRRARVAMIATRPPGSDNMKIHVLKQTNGIAGRYVEVTFHGAAAMIAEIESPAEVIPIEQLELPATPAPAPPPPKLRVIEGFTPDPDENREPPEEG